MRKYCQSVECAAAENKAARFIASLAACLRIPFLWLKPPLEFFPYLLRMLFMPKTDLGSLLNTKCQEYQDSISESDIKKIHSYQTCLYPYYIYTEVGFHHVKSSLGWNVDYVIHEPLVSSLILKLYIWLLPFSHPLSLSLSLSLLFLFMPLISTYSYSFGMRLSWLQHIHMITTVK